MAVYGRNMWEEGGLIISSIRDGNILYETNKIIKHDSSFPDHCVRKQPVTASSGATLRGVCYYQTFCLATDNRVFDFDFTFVFKVAQHMSQVIERNMSCAVFQEVLLNLFCLKENSMAVH
jgi:hypothetical protein